MQRLDHAEIYLRFGVRRRIFRLAQIVPCSEGLIPSIKLLIPPDVGSQAHGIGGELEGPVCSIMLLEPLINADKILHHGRGGLDKELLFLVVKGFGVCMEDICLSLAFFSS